MKKLIFLVVAVVISIWLLSFIMSVLPAGWMIIPTALTFMPINLYLGFKIEAQIAHLQNEAEGR